MYIVYDKNGNETQIRNYIDFVEAMATGLFHTKEDYFKEIEKRNKEKSEVPEEEVKKIDKKNRFIKNKIGKVK